MTDMSVLTKPDDGDTDRNLGDNPGHQTEVAAVCVKTAHRK
jgi:hypothetical protein